MAIMVAISVCFLQIDNLTSIPITSQGISLSETSTPIQDSHIPQVFNVANQKYTNQTKNVSDFPIPQSQGDIVFYNSSQVTLGILTFQTPWNSKIYIKNLTLLV